MSIGDTKSASLSLTRCRLAMCPIDRMVVPPILRTRSAGISMLFSISPACSSSSR
jgi:hypothetical protein